MAPTISAKEFDAIISEYPPVNPTSIGYIREQIQSILSIYTPRFVAPAFGAMITASPSSYSVLADIMTPAMTPASNSWRLVNVYGEFQGNFR